MMKKSHSFYVVVFLVGVFLLDYYLYRLTGFRIRTLAILFAIFIALLLLGCVIEWLDRPRKRTLRNHADKINALVEFFQARDERTEAERWSHFQQLYPEISQPEIGELKDQLFRMKHIAYNLALQQHTNKLNRKDFSRALTAEFPELNPKSLGRLFADAKFSAR